MTEDQKKIVGVCKLILEDWESVVTNISAGICMVIYNRTGLDGVDIG